MINTNTNTNTNKTIETKNDGKGNENNDGKETTSTATTTSTKSNTSVTQLMKETSDRALDMLPDTLVRHWTIWPIVHSLNFYYNPIHHRVLVQNIVLIFWSGYLSHLNNGGLELMTPEKEVELTVIKRRETKKRLQEEKEEQIMTATTTTTTTTVGSSSKKDTPLLATSERINDE